MSRVGRKPIPIPKGVEVKVAGPTVIVKGPKGELSRVIHSGLNLEIDGAVAHVRQTETGRQAGALFGLTRTLIHNMVEGVSAGYTRPSRSTGPDTGPRSRGRSSS